MSPDAFGDVYQEVSPIYWIGSNVCAMSTGRGPGTLDLSTSCTESAMVSASFSYSASDLSADVGFSVSISYTISLSYSVYLSSGQSATINVYPIYAGSLFSKTNIFTGSVYYGRAYRPIGAEYRVTYY